MKHLLWGLAGLTLAIGCKTIQAPLVQIPDSEEFRSLDTLVVSAPKFDLGEETVAEENYSLPTFNASQTRVHDLLHTVLHVHFDWAKEQVIGQATLTLKPYFYATNTVRLDAKGFELNKVRFSGSDTDLKYDYDGQEVVIDLGREFGRDELFELFIDYVATPKSSGGSAAITSDKGLFFINPTGEEDKPQQIWTQGETEHNSRWFPTIDKPNERCTQELYVTVDDRFKTLSNGLLEESTKNEDGTRTDYWKMDQAHAPYLFMLAVGEFAVVQERWDEMLLEYYVEPEYREWARDIFPYTPEMLTLFSDRLGVKYPWQKYSQVVVRDYVSGAMENTTAVIFGEFMQGQKADLVDNLTNEKIVAHEMFHHWFGDYVTCESWANLTMNEGFANYSEYIWLEHKYGKEEADFHMLQEFRGYLAQAATTVHPLIHYGHGESEEMFDQHSYNKGGMVLHMLRDYVGDEAFWAGLNLYLTRNAYSEVEADELRLAFEDVTGKDLIWFFDQWYHQAGHPTLRVTNEYDKEAGKIIVYVEQLQDPSTMPAIFQLPVAIDLYVGKEKMRKDVFINQRTQTFEFEVAAQPALVNFDAKKILLAEIEEIRTEAEYAFQYDNAKTFLDRYQAIQSLSNEDSETAQSIMRQSISDPFYGIRSAAVYQANLEDEAVKEQVIKLAEKDPKASVRAAAVDRIVELNDTQYLALFERVLKNDPASSVQSIARQAIGVQYVEAGDLNKLSFFKDNWESMDGFDAINFIGSYADLAAKGEVDDMLQAGDTLKEVGMTNNSPWKRFAAVKALNVLHNKLMEADATEADETILGHIQSIKEKETDPQLSQIYANFPN